MVAVRKQSPPSWTKLSTDILNVAANNSDLAATTAATTAAAVVTEQSKSFLDTASKQLRDFKQVFRQNLSFGNEAASSAAATMSTAASTSTMTTPASTASGNVTCAVDNLPTVLKLEIKENISPEHTINEETTRNILKLYDGSAKEDSSSTDSSAAAEETANNNTTLPCVGQTKNAPELQESNSSSSMTEHQLAVPFEQQDVKKDN